MVHSGFLNSEAGVSEEGAGRAACERPQKQSLGIGQRDIGFLCDDPDAQDLHVLRVEINVLPDVPAALAARA